MAYPSSIATQRRIHLSLPLLVMIAAVMIMSTGLVAIQASSLSGIQFSFWRLWVGVVALGVVATVRVVTSRPGERPALSSLRWAIWPGLLVGFAQPVMITAMKLTSVTDVALLTSLVPLMVSLIAVPMLGERPGNRFRLWAVLAIGGAGLVAYGGSTGIEGNPLGIGLACVSLIGWSFYMVLLKIARAHLDAIILLWTILAIAAISVTLYMAVTGWDLGSVTGRDRLLVGYVGVLPGGLGLALMTWSYRWLPANVPPLVLRAEPVLAGAQAWWLLSEPITALHFVGGGITIVGVVGAVMDPTGRRLMSNERSKADLAERV